MAVNFPSNPTNGDTVAVGGINYVYDSTQGVWSDSPQGLAQSIDNLTDVDTSTTAPANRQVLQWSSTNEEWGPADSGVQVYATIDDLPLSGVTEGSMALVDSTDKLYIFSDTGWYSIALVNQTPSITGVSATYTLATNGTATTVTVTATDPEGLPLTYSIVSDTSGNIATVSQGTGANTNQWTITPSTNSANAGNFTLVFRASDGTNIASASSTFTLVFSVANSKYTTALITSVGANNAVNDSFDDASTNNHTITATGNATQSTFSPYRHGGYSTYFDGSGDNLTTASAILSTSGAFTVQCWVYLDDTSNAAIWAQGTSGNAARASLSIESGNWYAQIGSAVINTTTAVANVWKFLEFQYDGSQIELFVDGTSVGTASNSTNAENTGLFIGKLWAANYDLQGYMTDLRVINGTPTGSSTVPTERLTAVTNTQLLTCHLPYIVGNANRPVGYTGSASITGSSANLNSGTLANAFDGSLSTSVAIRNSGSFIEFTFPQQQTGELQVNITNGNDSGDNNVQFWIDGVAGTSFDVSSQSWYSLTSSSDSFTTVKLEHSGSTTANIYGFRIGTSGDTITGLRPDITVNGNTKTEPFAPYNYQTYSASDNGGSVFLTGTNAAGEHLYVNDANGAVALGGGDSTVEMWIYPTSTKQCALMDYRNDNNNPTTAPMLWLDASNQPYFYLGAAQRILHGSVCTPNQWHHIALVRSSGVWSLYLNGVAASTTYTDSTTMTTHAYRPIIGRSGYHTTSNSSSNQYHFPGHIADARFVVGTAVYTSNFTPSTAPLTAITNTQLLISGTNAGIIDKSQSVKAITLQGDVKSSTTQTKYLSSSMYFDGTGDGLSTSETMNLGTGDFTLEAWLYPTSLGANDTIISEHWSGTAGGFIFRIHTNNYLSLYDGSTNIASSTAITTNQWQHVAASRQSGTLKLFVDGTQVLSTSNSSNFNGPNSGEVLEVGAISTTNGPVNNFTGYISDARVTKGYARYTSNFTAPTAALQG